MSIFEAVYHRQKYIFSDNKIIANKPRLVPNREKDEGIHFVTSSTLGEEEIIVIVTQTNNSQIALGYFQMYYPHILIKATSKIDTNREIYGLKALKYKYRTVHIQAL